MASPIGSNSSNPILRKATEFKEKVEKYAEEHEELVDAVKTGQRDIKEALVDGFEAVGRVKEKGFKEAAKTSWADYAHEYKDPEGKLNLLGKVGLAGRALGAVTGAISLPKAFTTAVKDVREAVKSGSAHDIRTATESVQDVVTKGLETVDHGLLLATTGNKLVSTYRAAGAAFRAAAPGASKAAVAAASRAAAKGVFEGAAKGAVKTATRAAAMDAARSAGALAHAVEGAGSRAAAKAALAQGSKAAAEAAVKAGEHAAAGTLAKVAGRFAPGLNVGFAVVDTAVAVATLRDPQASKGRKICSCITAAGSIAAATNVPIVSQVGAAVSAVSGIVGAFFK